MPSAVIHRVDQVIMRIKSSISQFKPPRLGRVLTSEAVIRRPLIDSPSISGQRMLNVRAWPISNCLFKRHDRMAELLLILVRVKLRVEPGLCNLDV